MKSIVTVIAALLSLSLYAGSSFMLGGHFSGSGVWKDGKGHTGSYQSSMSKTKLSADSFKVTGSVTVNGQTHSWTSVIHHDGYGIFSVFNQDESAQIGTGYCFPHEKSGTCHMDLQLKGATLEETVHFEGKNIYRIGSKTVEGKKYMYNDHLVPSSSSQQQQQRQQQQDQQQNQK